MKSDAAISLSQFTDETALSYDNMLCKIVSESRKSGSFLEIYFLSSDQDIKNAMWKFARLPHQKRLLVMDMIDAFSQGTGIARKRRPVASRLAYTPVMAPFNGSYSAASSA
jgi:hypothetical protein